MPKKGSLKTQTPPAGDKVVKKDKEPNSEQKKGHEIDEIFTRKKKRKNGIDGVEKPKEKHKKTNVERKKLGKEIVEVFFNRKKSMTEPNEGEKPKENDKKPSLEQKKPGNEIDEIFSSKQKKLKELKEIAKAEEKSSAKVEKMKKKKKRSKVSESDGFVDPPSRPRRKTNDGFTVYSAEELGLTKSEAGGTRDCPFDCSCCF